MIAESTVAIVGNKAVHVSLDYSGAVTVTVSDRPVDDKSLSTRQAGVRCILTELKLHGISTTPVNGDAVFRTIPNSSNPSLRHFSMNTSRYKHQWVIANWDFGDSVEGLWDADNTPRLRVMVDQAGELPLYYILPETEYRKILRDNRESYLAKNGGTRPKTPESRHTNITTSQVEEWRDRWDLFGRL